MNDARTGVVVVGVGEHGELKGAGSVEAGCTRECAEAGAEHSWTWKRLM